jgi:hypothetical protein
MVHYREQVKCDKHRITVQGGMSDLRYFDFVIGRLLSYYYRDLEYHSDKFRSYPHIPGMDENTM